MASSTLVKLYCALILCIVVGAPHGAEAALVGCGQVTNNVASCIGYLRGGPGPSVACCNGIKTLNGLAKTTPDRQIACKCLKSDAAAISGLNYGTAAGLPGKCGVSVPYVISPNTDCTKVH